MQPLNVIAFPETREVCEFCVERLGGRLLDGRDWCPRYEDFVPMDFTCQDWEKAPMN